MDTTYGKAVALAVPVFLTLIAIEILVDIYRRTNYYRLADAINSLSCGIVSTGMRVFFGFLGLYTYEWTLHHAALFSLPANHWGTWAFAFVLYDLCYYWNHRLGHTVGLFWASHVVHHQSEEFNLTTALRQTGTGSFVGWIFYIPMALCGVPVAVFLAVALAQLFYQFWPHTRHIGRLGFLDRWVQTPSNHRVHHAQNTIYLDRNYVGVFMIWDRVFGTFQQELDQEPCIYGIRGQLKSWNPVWANLHYYLAMAKDAWHARRWTDKVKVWFAHPGWRPADVAARFPKPEYDPQRDFARFDPPRGLLLSVYALVQFIAVIATNSHFLSVLPKAGLITTLAYFAYITFTLISLGGVLENRRSFLALEAARLGLTATAVLATRAWFGASAPVLAPAIAGFCALALVFLAYAARAETRKGSVAAAAA